MVCGRVTERVGQESGVHEGCFHGVTDAETCLCRGRLLDTHLFALPVWRGICKRFHYATDVQPPLSSVEKL